MSERKRRDSCAAGEQDPDYGLNDPAPVCQTEEPSPWRDIETAPKDGTWIVLLFPDLGVWPAFWSTQVFSDGFWSVSDNKGDDLPLRGWSKEPTAWHPLPAPPEPRS